MSIKPPSETIKGEKSREDISFKQPRARRNESSQDTEKRRRGRDRTAAKTSTILKADPTKKGQHLEDKHAQTA